MPSVSSREQSLAHPMISISSCFAVKVFLEVGDRTVRFGSEADFLVSSSPPESQGADHGHQGTNRQRDD